MVQRTGFGLLLGALLLPSVSVAEEPNVAERSVPYDSQPKQRIVVVRKDRVSSEIYRPGQAASALPHWWHHPRRMILPVKQTVWLGPLGQKGIRYNHQPPSFQYLGPRGPIILEEEPLLGFE